MSSAAGYRLTTAAGATYDVVDFDQDAVPDDFPREYSLYGSKVSRTWQEADFRINFAKNKTHEEYFYTLCLKNLLAFCRSTTNIFTITAVSSAGMCAWRSFRSFPCTSTSSTRM